jgi:hypothetical protein
MEKQLHRCKYKIYQFLQFIVTVYPVVEKIVYVTHSYSLRHSPTARVVS